MNSKISWTAIKGLVNSIGLKPVTVAVRTEDAQHLEKLASSGNRTLQEIMRKAIVRGMNIHDFDELEKKRQQLLQENAELSQKIDELGGLLYKLGSQHAALHYNYFESFSINQALTMHLCGMGLGSEYRDMLDRYLFAGRYESKSESPTKKDQVRECYGSSTR